MAYDFLGRAIESGKMESTPVQKPAPISMFNFQPKQTAVEDNFMTKDEVRQAIANVTDKSAALDKLVQGGFILEGYNDTPSAVTTPPAPQEMGMASKVGQFGKNISAGIASGASQAVGGTLGILGDFLSAPFSEDVSLGGIFTGKNKGGLGQLARDETARQQQAGAESFGANTESLGYKSGKIGTGLALSVATPGGVMGLAGKGAGLATRAGLGAVQGGIETGKFLGLTEGRLGTPTELATGAAFGAALPIAGAGIKAGARYGADLLGKSTGAGGDAIRNAFKYAGNPDFVKALRGEITDTEILANANQALQSIRQNRNAVYGKGYEKFLQKSNEIGEQNIDDITASFLEKVKGLGVKVKDDVLDFSKSKIANSGDEKLLTETLADLRKFSKSTPEELDILKQRIYDRFVVEKPIGTTTASEGIAKLVSGEIKNKLVNMIPEYKVMSKTYEEATGAIAEISKTLSLGKPNAAMTAMTRLAQTMKDNLSYRGEALKLLEELSGVNLTAQLAGAALAPGIGKGLAGVAQGQLGAGIGLGIAGLSNPAFWAAIPLGSPRFIGELANGLGVTAKALKLALSKIPGGNVAQGFVASRSTANPFKDISFIKKLGSGQVKGLSPEATNIMKGVKTPKEAMERAKQKDIANEVTKAYSNNNSVKSSIIDKGVDKVEKGFEDVKSFVESVKNKDFKGKSLAQQFINTSKYVGVAPYQKEDGSWGITLVPGWKALAKAGKLALKDLPTTKKSATIKPIAPKTEKMAVSNVEDDIIKEARKYGSAEEFVKNYTLDSQLPPQANTFKYVKLSDIKGLDSYELENAIKSGKSFSKSEIEKMITPTDEFVKGKPVKNAIELDSQGNLMGGNHRIAQALLNGDEKILAWQGNKGDIKLKDIYNKSKTEKMAVSVEDDLIKEARKYGNAEEFVKSLENTPNIYFHGTNKKFDKFSNDFIGSGEGSSMVGQGVNITKGKWDAENYAYKIANRKGGEENIIVTKIKPNLKVYDFDKLEFGEYGKNKEITDLIDYIVNNQKDFKGLTAKDIVQEVENKGGDGWNMDLQKIYGFNKEISNYIKSKGYDGVKTMKMSSDPFGKNKPVENLTIFNPDNIKIIDPTDIYNKSKTK